MHALYFFIIAWHLLHCPCNLYVRLEGKLVAPVRFFLRKDISLQMEFSSENFCGRCFLGKQMVVRMDTNDSLRAASLWHSMHAISQHYRRQRVAQGTNSLKRMRMHSISIASKHSLVCLNFNLICLKKKKIENWRFCFMLCWFSVWIPGKCRKLKEREFIIQLR